MLSAWCGGDTRARLPILRRRARLGLRGRDAGGAVRGVCVRPARGRDGGHPTDLLRALAAGVGRLCRVRPRGMGRDPVPADRAAGVGRSRGVRGGDRPAVCHTGHHHGIPVGASGVGTWWTWDPQLVTYLILWLIYAGYLVLRAAAGDDPRQARFAAVFAIVGFVDVPLVWLSARYLRALSPVIFTTRSIGLAPSMAWALLAGLVAWSLLYIVLVRARIRLGVLELRLQALIDERA